MTATVDFLSQPVTLRPRRQTINSIVAVSGIEVDNANLILELLVGSKDPRVKSLNRYICVFSFTGTTLTKILRVDF